MGLGWRCYADVRTKRMIDWGGEKDMLACDLMASVDIVEQMTQKDLLVDPIVGIRLFISGTVNITIPLISDELNK